MSNLFADELDALSTALEDLRSVPPHGRFTD
jgi:hypothetical protein